MAQTGYRTAPIPSSEMPKGIPYIVGNEAAERFSFYGMRSILVIFMTKYLLDSQGSPAVMGEEEAKEIFHRFVAIAYFFPILGAILSDSLLGKYRTIISLSIVYCLGHLALTFMDSRLGLTWGLQPRTWLMVGLALIAVGQGGIKPCVSAHVGDQFGASNQHLLTRVFGWFYFSINLGAFSSTLLTPWLLRQEGLGPAVAFGVPGVLMLLATIAFWMGRWKFVHVPPGGRRFLGEIFSRDGLSATRNLSIIYVFIAMFWALFDQTGSAWVLQAEQMDRVIDLAWLPWPLSAVLPSQFELLSSQIQAANPALIMILIPLFAWVVYPVIDRVFPLTYLRKISMGFFLTAASFAISAWIQTRIDAGQSPHIIWQIVAYVVLTAAEVMVSITGLEFSYTQAPKTMKSLVMALWFLAVALGNFFTSAVNRYIQNEDGSSKLDGANYYWFFTVAMLLTAIAFVLVAVRYRGRTYIQDESR